jgi:aspartate aminotransferase
VEAMRQVFETRKDLMLKKMGEIPHIDCIKPEGAFYIMMDCSYYLEKLSLPSTTELCELLLDEASVAVVPGKAFGMDSHVRLSYATSEALITEGLDRIRQFLTR